MSRKDLALVEKVDDPSEERATFPWRDGRFVKDACFLNDCRFIVVISSFIVFLVRHLDNCGRCQWPTIRAAKTAKQTTNNEAPLVHSAFCTFPFNVQKPSRCDSQCHSARSPSRASISAPRNSRTRRSTNGRRSTRRLWFVTISHLPETCL